jgi:hypothetical protein
MEAFFSRETVKIGTQCYPVYVEAIVNSLFSPFKIVGNGQVKTSIKRAAGISCGSFCITIGWFYFVPACSSNSMAS